MSKRYEVIVVGGGPVGVALAVDLGMRGVHCALVERRQQLQQIPKGQNLSQRTLEHFYFWGIEPELRAARAMPRGFPTGDVLAYESLSSEYWRAAQGRAQLNSIHFRQNDRIPQYRTEEVLRRKMATLDTVDPWFGWNAASLSQDDKGVRIAIEKDGQQQTLEADYLVGSDGAHSLVREQVGIKRGGRSYDKLMVLAVFRSPQLNDGLKRFPEASLYRVLHPDLHGFWRFMGRVEPDSFFYHAPVPDGTDRKNFDMAQELYGFTGFEFDFEPMHVGFWDSQISVAQDYRAGRVFIAGDAAHSHPPYGGYGLNNGLEDAVNLGWKFGAVFAGWGGPRLLDSYAAERRPIFQETADDFINALVDEEAAFLAQYDPRRDRDAFLKGWKSLDGFSGSAPRRYEPNYEGSPVVMGPAGAKCSAHGEHIPKARSGHHLSSQVLSTGRNVFEMLGSGMTLLAFDTDQAELQRLEDAARKHHVPLKIVQDSYAEGRLEYESQMILVRPDRYIVWTGNQAPHDVDRIVARVSGQT